jgi:phospholipid transport system substrate-binding protein
MCGGGGRCNRATGPVLLAALLVLVVPVFAAQEQLPQELIRSVTSSVLDTLRSQGDDIRTDQNKLVALMEDKVVPYFDFRLISGQVLGRYWRTASEQQRDQFTEAFQKLLTNTYAAVFGRYEGQTVVVKAAQSTPNPDRVIVPTTVKSRGQPDIEVDYRLYLHDGKWQIYDVVVDGISLLINYRSEYGTALAQGSLDSLIARLKAKNAAFKARGE